MNNPTKFLSQPMEKLNKLLYILIAIVLMQSFTSVRIAGADTATVPKQLLIDNANLFTPAQRAVILDSLTTFARNTSNGIMVATVTDLNGDTPIEAAYKIGEQTGLGTKEHDNGVVILIKPKVGNSRGEMAIAVGYGLEGAIPDAICKRIITQEAIPEFSTGNYYQGVMNSLGVIMPLARGEISISDYGDSSDDGAATAIFGIIAIVVAMILVVVLSRNGNDDSSNNGRNGGGGRTFGVAPIIFPMGGFGGSNSFGSSGGFGGFGGFGGGSFGGGGASGSW